MPGKNTCHDWNHRQMLNTTPARPVKSAPCKVWRGAGSVHGEADVELLIRDGSTDYTPGSYISMFGYRYALLSKANFNKLWVPCSFNLSQMCCRWFSTVLTLKLRRLAISLLV